MNRSSCTRVLVTSSASRPSSRHPLDDPALLPAVLEHDMTSTSLKDNGGTCPALCARVAKVQGAAAPGIVTKRTRPRKSGASAPSGLVLLQARSQARIQLDRSWVPPRLMAATGLTRGPDNTLSWVVSPSARNDQNDLIHTIYIT